MQKPACVSLLGQFALLCMQALWESELTCRYMNETGTCKMELCILTVYNLAAINSEYKGIHEIAQLLLMIHVVH